MTQDKWQRLPPATTTTTTLRNSPTNAVTMSNDRCACYNNNNNTTSLSANQPTSRRRRTTKTTTTTTPSNNDNGYDKDDDRSYNFIPLLSNLQFQPTTSTPTPTTSTTTNNDHPSASVLRLPVTQPTRRLLGVRPSVRSYAQQRTSVGNPSSSSLSHSRRHPSFRRRSLDTVWPQSTLKCTLA